MADRQDEIEQLKHELGATQFWMRELFCIVAGDETERFKRFVVERVKSAKNSPPEHGLTQSRYDEFALARVPYIERIGEDIVEWLER